MKRVAMIFAIAIGAFLCGLVIMKLTNGFDQVWNRAGGPTTLAPINFQALKKTQKPNQFLLCPPGFCADAPDKFATVFDMSASDLQLKFHAIALADDTVTHIEFENQSLAEGFISRAGFFRFPNLINVQYIELENGQSTLAIYARAKLGTYDFDANKKLIERWLSNLN